MIVCCLLNLGPVFFIALSFFVETSHSQKIYQTEKEANADKVQIQFAEYSTKTKEALCENLPMLILVCFKMSLSSKVTILELISSASSTCLFGKLILTNLSAKSIGTFKKILGSLLLGSHLNNKFCY